MNGLCMGLCTENLAKPISLAIRLDANIFAGEVLITVILKFMPPPLWQGQLPHNGWAAGSRSRRQIVRNTEHEVIA